MSTQGLSTIGIDVKVNNVSMNYVTEQHQKERPRRAGRQGL